MSKSPVQDIGIYKISSGTATETADKVAVEEPLEIQLKYSSNSGCMLKNIAVTMRTPGNDIELAAGFLFTEGIISNNNAIEEIVHPAADNNRVLAILKEGVVPVLGNATRNFYITSGCGICGKASIEAISTVSSFAGVKNDSGIHAAVLYTLQVKLKKQQQIFEDTGGIHASALFDSDAALILLREDVGRHNALDKLIGAALLNDQLPLNNHILFLSGRASFELVQKAVMAGIKIIAAVGAPSSLAVELAKENDITLIGFLRNDRFNIYCGENRIVFQSNIENGLNA